MGNKESLCFTLQRKQGTLIYFDKEVRFVFQALNPMRRMGCGSSFTTCLPRRRLPAFTTSSWVIVRNRKVLSGIEGCDMIRWAMHLMIPCSIRLCSQRPLPKILIALGGGFHNQGIQPCPLRKSVGNCVSARDGVPFPSARPHCNRQSRTGEGNVPASRGWYGASAASCPHSHQDDNHVGIGF